MPQSTTHTTITKVSAIDTQTANDILAVEEPLEIKVKYGNTEKNISVTMRTPGNDEELAAGFLFTEGVIKKMADVSSVAVVKENTVLLTMADGAEPVLNNAERNFYTTSSCGVCGKASIDAVKVACHVEDVYPYDSLKCAPELIYSLPEILRKEQAVFEQTGGLHACALFSMQGKLLLLREDVGRHNALDKLIGAALNNKMVPLSEHILMLSGRASFELVQKAAMAGIKIIAAVGAPSSLAVQMAEEWNMTLIGFLRGQKFNIYSGAQRIVNL